MTKSFLLQPILLATAALGLGLNCAHAASPFLPATGAFVLTPSLSYQSFDEFSPGGGKAQLPQNIIRRSTRVQLDYGLSDTIAFDASIGYVKATSFAGSESALADTYLGARYRFASEATDSYAGATRLGITLPGNYDTGQLHSPGDDAFGADLSVGFSKHLISIFRGGASAGYYYNSKDVPDSYMLKLETVASLTKALKLDFSWKYFAGRNGLDIGGPGFTGLNDLPKVQEKGQVLELGLAYADEGGRYYRVFASQLVRGRNVGEERTYGASVSFTF